MFIHEPSINLAYYGPSPQPSAMRRAQPEQPKATVNLQIIPVRVLHATYSSRVRRSPKPPSRAQPVDTGPTRPWGTRSFASISSGHLRRQPHRGLLSAQADLILSGSIERTRLWT